MIASQRAAYSIARSPTNALDQPSVRSSIACQHHRRGRCGKRGGEHAEGQSSEEIQRGARAGADDRAAGGARRRIGSMP